MSELSSGVSGRMSALSFGVSDRIFALYFGFSNRMSALSPGVADRMIALQSRMSIRKIVFSVCLRDKIIVYVSLFWGFRVQSGVSVNAHECIRTDSKKYFGKLKFK